MRFRTLARESIRRSYTLAYTSLAPTANISGLFERTIQKCQLNSNKNTRIQRQDRTYRLGLMAMLLISVLESIGLFRLSSRISSLFKQSCCSRRSNCLELKYKNKIKSIYIVFPTTYNTEPSSDEVHSMFGLSGQVARLFTRLLWHEQLHTGDDPPRSTSQTWTLQSAAPVATRESPEFGMNLTANILP